MTKREEIESGLEMLLVSIRSLQRLSSEVEVSHQKAYCQMVPYHVHEGFRLFKHV